MNRKVYISAKDEIKKEILKQQTRYQLLYTNDVSEAEILLIVRKPDGTLEDEQFHDLMIAKENGAKIQYVKEEQIKKMQIRETRKRLDMEME
ncbi:hypothetical protein [Emergencia sp. 1XD21-10]|uniref:hypothetical protein n=1 Tax=Emergencia sp. 1XD21-10 TaxID=2304569 RepID=UPI00137A6702|nr:hypothetical protein [Emergencia sp. 1XD21-10]NCE98111.1 hypothetical protein [Emergencia sp. 1XD21-10]